MAISMNSKWSENALDLVYKRYIPNRNMSIEEWIHTVCQNITKEYSGEEKDRVHSAYYKMLYSRKFLPTSACLHNSISGKGGLAGCTVLPLPSNSNEIFHSLLPKIYSVLKYGTGVGLDFSVLAPRLSESIDGIGTNPGVCEVLSTIVTATDGIMIYEGLKRAAFMASLNYNHPDIFEFIHIKSKKKFRNVNISVSINDDFSNALLNEVPIPLCWESDGKVINLNEEKLMEIHERAKQRASEAPDLSIINVNQIYSASFERVVGFVLESELFFYPSRILEAISESAHKCGDPGILNMSAINLDNPTHPSYFEKNTQMPIEVGVLTATTPCGEQPLLPYEVCHLGSFNLALFLENDKFNFDEFRKTIQIAVRFMDDVIEVGDNGLSESNYMAKANRKMGLGIMGLADVLAYLEIPYNSEEGIRFASEIVSFLNKEAILASQKLAEERGAFTSFANSKYKNEPPRRHATLTTIAPTGHISTLANCSTSIEPYFLLSYYRDSAGKRVISNEFLEEKLSKENYSLSEWIKATKNQNSDYEYDGTIGGLLDEPTNNLYTNSRLKKIKQVFVTSHEIDPIVHLKIVSELQKYVDNGISKTINLANAAKVKDVYNIFYKSIELKVKGITVFRDGCLSEQALTKVECCPNCGETKYLNYNDCNELRCDNKIGGCGYEGPCNL